MDARMTTSTGLLLLLLLLLLGGQSWTGAEAHSEVVVCEGTACYTAHWGKLRAAEAQNRCKESGGNLATVKSKEEALLTQRALAQLLRTKAPLETKMGKFWIGLQREKGTCLDPDLPLRGFSWVDGGMDTAYSNWYKESKSSCITNRCVSLMLDLSLTPQPSQLPKWADSPCGASDALVSNIEGFLCKFSFKGMCRPLVLGGPGRVTYNTPFLASTSSLEAVPFASEAEVSCGTENKSSYFLCKEKTPGIFLWDSPGPLCVSPEYGCSFNNGGCQQDCFEAGEGFFRCGCQPGFQLLDDLMTCASRNPCSSNPCTGQATCVPVPQGENYTCHCPRGYQLDSSQLDCEDVDECQDSPCAQECVNTRGGYHCECWVGYQPGGSEEEACKDVDECAADHSPCAQGCINTDGSFYCFCEKGYALSGEDSTQCEDVDECLNHRGSPCDGMCFNTQGSFYCGCAPGWELASDGVSCTTDPASLVPAAGPPGKEDKGDTKRSTTSPAIVSSPTGDSGSTVKKVPTRRNPPLLSDRQTASAPPEMLTTTGSPGVRMVTGLPTTSGHNKSTNEDPVSKQSDKQSDDGTDGQKLLLFYILGTVVAISLLLALALGLLIYRKRRAKKEEIKEKKPQNAADSYSWASKRSENRALENQYSLTPGTDC